MLIYPGQMDPPANWAQVYRSLWHQDIITYRRMQTCWYTQGRWTPHSSSLSVTQPYYTRTVLSIEECRHADIPRADGPPALTNHAQVYRTLLHQDSITYRRMQTCWYTQGRWTPKLIEPKCTDPYDTRTLLPIEECRHADIPRGDAPPANWAQVYRSLWHQDIITYRRMQTCWSTQGRWTPCSSSLSVQSPTTPGQYNL